ncbi:Bug family tripartite tricarboxylate transporter substrate binding protein [Phreatobacter stygius]|uniref:Tripartite tricarboxylate transporter substrate binding protein n=1 Tax=Phreatobacter stygius TaxID=1940610 RepID=A0A4D7B4J5_9HYPH|nr:tripartite tricarboxylate transporter substrate binding protein [Phreatobacter stygius]QCI62947.1 tripartite tricarboxylate transporter substrate binding protein [Phreatobacter stygius]
MAATKTVLSAFVWSAAILLAATGMALAQYPNRPISIMVGFSAGGTSDVAARILAERMSQSLRTPVIVENRPGAGGSVAAAATARATPDGYAIMLSDPGAFAINPIAFPQNARYDSLTDFVPIALVGQSPLVLVVPANRPFTTIAALNAHLRSHAGTANYASSGNAGISQFGAELYLKRAGDLAALHIPYRGGAPMMEALYKGEVDFGVAVLASAVALIEGGAVRAVALAAPSATPAVANVPLLERLGFPNSTMTSWVIMIGPRGMPPDVVARLNAAINDAISDPGVRQRLLSAGIETYPPATPAETGDYLKGEVERYRAYQTELGDRLTR